MLLNRALEHVVDQSKGNPWKVSQYKSTLKLYEQLAVVELFKGNTDKGELANEILSNAKNSKDKVCIQLALTKVNSQEGKKNENLTHQTSDVLLAERADYPKRSFARQANISWTRPRCIVFSRLFRTINY